MEKENTKDEVLQAVRILEYLRTAEVGKSLFIGICGSESTWERTK